MELGREWGGERAAGASSWQGTVMGNARQSGADVQCVHKWESMSNNAAARRAERRLSGRVRVS